MNCLEFRRAIGADPNHASAESIAHRAQCPTCEKYAQEMLRLNGLIKRALEVPVSAAAPLSLDDSKLPHASPRWYAMAASVTLLVSAMLGSLWFLGFPRESLATEVVNHLVHEPDAMTRVETRISAELLDGALKAKGLRLSQPLNDVSYLESCEIRGHLVPHLVMQTERGPVTVLLLTEETVASEQHFDEQSYHGTLVPMARGAMAVLATDASLVDAVAARIKAAVVE